MSSNANARIRIRDALRMSGGNLISQTEIRAETGLSQSLISRVLKEMVYEGKVYADRSITPIRYCMKDDQGRSITPITSAEMAHLLRSWSDQEFKLKIHENLDRMRLIMVGLYMNALNGAEGDTIDPQLLKNYQAVMKEAHLSAQRMMDVAAKMLAQFELWDSAAITSFLLDGQEPDKVRSRVNKLHRSGS